MTSVTNFAAFSLKVRVKNQIARVGLWRFDVNDPNRNKKGLFAESDL